jgi:hypothetical protein
LAFIQSWLIYAFFIPNAPATLAWTDCLRGFLSYSLLLLQLRAVDDLADIERDPLTAGTRQQARQLFRALLPAILIALCALNWGHTKALLSIAGATVLAYTGPFIIMRYCRPSPLNLILAWFVFEGAPAGIFLFPYFAWLPTNVGFVEGLGAAATVTALYWVGYEFWKFSRKLHTEEFQPYFLSRQGIVVVLIGLLVISLLPMYRLHASVFPSIAYFTYSCVVTLAIIVSIACDRQKFKRAAWWSGMTVIAAVEGGVAIGMVAGAL